MLPLTVAGWSIGKIHKPFISLMIVLRSQVNLESYPAEARCNSALPLEKA